MTYRDHAFERSAGATTDGGTPVAEVRVRGHHGVFVAEVCEMSDGWVRVEGRWCERTGANYASVRIHPRARYAWPRGRVIEVRWAGDE